MMEMDSIVVREWLKLMSRFGVSVVMFKFIDSVV